MEELLKKLQNSDQRTKMRAAIIFTALAMIVVVVVWLAYFNTLVTVGTTASTTNVESDEFSLWGSVKSGTAMMFDNIKGFFGSKDIEVNPGN